MKHWIFDFDGTLVDSDGIFYKTLSYALKPFQVNVADNFMEQIRHKHPHRIFEDILTEAQSEKALTRLRVIGQELSETIQPFPGIKKVLQTLQSKGVTLSIWTGRDQASTLRILKRTGLAPYFGPIVSGTCVTTNKPGTDGLLELKNHHQAVGSEMVMIGDHHHDIEPANQLGLVSIHAQWKREPHQLPSQVQPRFCFRCTDEFNQWIHSQLKE